MKTLLLILGVMGILGWSYVRQCDGIFREYEHELAVCAIFKNEAPFLKEWIDYHHDLLGVSKFYLYNNDSSDGYLEVLTPYIGNGLVELINWESRDEHAIDVEGICKFPWDRYQIGAYTECCRERARGKVRWLAVHDIDEFLVPPGGMKGFRKMLREASRPRLNKFLKNPFHFVNPIGCLKVHWLIYGTSHVWDLKEGQLLTETLTYRADDNYVEHRNTKCLYRPEAVDVCLIHNAYLNKGRYQSRDVPYSVCRVNHYFTGTEKRLIEKRKLPKEGFDDLQEKLNVVEDRSLIEFKKRQHIR